MFFENDIVLSFSVAYRGSKRLCKFWEMHDVIDNDCISTSSLWQRDCYEKFKDHSTFPACGIITGDDSSGGSYNEDMLLGSESLFPEENYYTMLVGFNESHVPLRDSNHDIEQIRVVCNEHLGAFGLKLSEKDDVPIRMDQCNTLHLFRAMDYTVPLDDNAVCLSIALMEVEQGVYNNHEELLKILESNDDFFAFVKALMLEITINPGFMSILHANTALSHNECQESRIRRQLHSRILIGPDVHALDGSIEVYIDIGSKDPESPIKVYVPLALTKFDIHWVLDLNTLASNENGIFNDISPSLYVLHITSYICETSWMHCDTLIYRTDEYDFDASGNLMIHNIPVPDAIIFENYAYTFDRSIIICSELVGSLSKENESVSLSSRVGMDYIVILFVLGTSFSVCA